MHWRKNLAAQKYGRIRVIFTSPADVRNCQACAKQDPDSFNQLAEVVEVALSQQTINARQPVK